jgi:NAD+ kinase
LSDASPVTPPRRIGVVGHARYAQLESTLQRVVAFAEERGKELFLEESLHARGSRGELFRPEDAASLDLLVSLGGDGTLLRAARLLGGHPVPILGVNLGNLGFLTAVAPEQVDEALAAVQEGEVLFDERMVLSVEAVAADGSTHGSYRALNDAVLQRGGVARMIRLRVLAGSEEVGTYSADGIILATPTGSTAYSLSAGGPIVAPAVECILATPVSPHTLAIRPLVLPVEERVTVEILAPSENLVLTIDGQESAALAPGDRLVVTRDPRRVILLRLRGQTFFGTLRRKLRWGDLVERGA